MLLSLSEIEVPKGRQRQEFDPEGHTELVDSITELGLLQPCGVRKGKILVWGERRLRALRDAWFSGAVVRYAGEVLPEGQVPCIDLGDVNELTAEASEHAENSHRRPLTWQEEALASARLDSLRRRQADASAAPPPSVADIALERRGRDDGYYHTTTARELIVAKHLNRPEVRSAKSLDEAFKVLKRTEDSQRNVALAEKVGRTFGAHLHRLILGDAYEELLTPFWFDVLLMDPPFGMGADEFGDSGGRAIGAHGYADSPELWTKFCQLMPTRALELTKPQAHFYSFCDIDGFHDLRVAMERAGWWVHRTPLMWHKPNAPRVPWPEHGPQRKYELILYAVKGKRPVNMIAPDVLTHASDENLGHAAQKPVSLYIDLLKRSVRPGDQVADFFCGTGTIFPAAHQLKCTALGIEKFPDAYGIAVKRLEGLKAQAELPLG